MHTTLCSFSQETNMRFDVCRYPGVCGAALYMRQSTALFDPFLFFFPLSVVGRLLPLLVLHTARQARYRALPQGKGSKRFPCFLSFAFGVYAFVLTSRARARVAAVLTPLFICCVVRGFLFAHCLTCTPACLGSHRCGISKILTRACLCPW